MQSKQIIVSFTVGLPRIRNLILLAKRQSYLFEQFRRSVETGSVSNAEKIIGNSG